MKVRLHLLLDDHDDRLDLPDMSIYNFRGVWWYISFLHKF